MKVLETTLLVLLIIFCLRGCVEKVGSTQAMGMQFRDWHDVFVVGYNYKDFRAVKEKV